MVGELPLMAAIPKFLITFNKRKDDFEKNHKELVKVVASKFHLQVGY